MQEFFKGYVTQLSFVQDKSAAYLEAALGYNRGALASGYKVFALQNVVRSDEFEWKDRTRYSDGWHADPSIRLGQNEKTVWSVQRADELRYALYKRHGYNERAASQEMDSIMSRELVKLNVRSGPNRIVKLRPNSHPSSYPESEFRSIPQWRLTVQKEFVLLLAV